MIASKIRATHFFDMQSGWRLAWKPHGPIRNRRIAGRQVQCSATAKLPRDGVKGSFGTFVQMNTATSILARPAESEASARHPAADHEELGGVQSRDIRWFPAEL